MICVFAQGLKMFDPEGKIYDFEGDEVLTAMDEELLQIFQNSSTMMDYHVLAEVSTLFQNSGWYRDLFGKIDLNAGEKAKKLLTAQNFV